MDMDFTPPFGIWLKAQRARLDLTQGDLARRVGYSPETIRKVESGALRPSKQIVDLLADHLGVPSAQRDAFLAFATDARTAMPQPTLTNLPTPATQLLGREGDVTAVRKLFRQRENRLVTLLGPPGVGKTRLAIEVAHQVKDEFADGVWFVPLAPVTDPQAALATILQALEAQPAPGLPPLDALKRHLRERELLLVLDNLEQVLDVAPLVAEVLASAPKVTALATSREPLRIAAEQRYAVPPLVSEPAVALFVQRARAVQPDFAPTPDVSEICAKLDRLPLAIELAAARAEVFTPKELLARLDKRLATLTLGGRDVPERQRTLRSTIDWSYQLLTPNEQAFFRRMGVFAGGFTLHAAQTFCEIDGLPLSGEDGIAGLLSKSLLVRDLQVDDASRYRILETIREYALDELKACNETDTWMENLSWYLVAVGRDFVLPGKVMPNELDNWRAALRWTQSAPDASGLALLLAPSGSFPWRETVYWLEQALALASAVSHPAAYTEALEGLGVLLNRIGEMRRGRMILERSLSICRTYDLRYMIDQTLWDLGHAAREGGDFAAACAYFEESERWSNEVGHTDRLRSTYITLAEVYVGMEEADVAERLLGKGIALAENADDKFNLAWGLNHLAHVAQLRSDFERASELLIQSIDIFEDVVKEHVFQVWGKAWGQQSLGEIALTQGQAATAQEMFVESLKAFDLLGEKMNTTWSLCGLAGTAALDEDPDRGAKLWGAGEGVRERIGCRIAPASRLNRERTAAMLRQQLGDEHFEAEQAIGRAMTLEQAVAYALKTPDRLR